MRLSETAAISVKAVVLCDPDRYGYGSTGLRMSDYETMYTSVTDRIKRASEEVFLEAFKSTGTNLNITKFSKFKLGEVGPLNQEMSSHTELTTSFCRSAAESCTRPRHRHTPPPSLRAA